MHTLLKYMQNRITIVARLLHITVYIEWLWYISEIICHRQSQVKYARMAEEWALCWQTDKPKISDLCDFIVEDDVLLNVSLVLGDKHDKISLKEVQNRNKQADRSHNFTQCVVYSTLINTCYQTNQIFVISSAKLVITKHNVNCSITN